MKKVNLFGFQFGTQTKTKSLVLSFLFFTAFTFDGFGQLGVFSNDNAPSTGNAIVEIKSDVFAQELPALKLSKVLSAWNWTLFSWDIGIALGGSSLDFTPRGWGMRLPTLSLSADGDLTVQRSLKTQSISGSDNRGVFVINNPSTTSYPAIELYNDGFNDRKGNIAFCTDATAGKQGAISFYRYVNTNAWKSSMEIDGSGNVTIFGGDFEIRNTDLSKQFKVYKDGTVRARRVQVDFATIPDYVFKPDYKLMPLDDLKTFIAQNNHLPNVPSEQEYKERGNIDLSELNLKLLEKVEELTLYVLQLQDRINSLESQIKK